MRTGRQAGGQTDRWASQSFDLDRMNMFGRALYSSATVPDDSSFFVKAFGYSLLSRRMEGLKQWNK